jgi:hypothetical protein
MAVDAFIKFEGLEGETHKLSNDFDRLGDGFADLGGAFIKLVDDVSSTATAFLKSDFAAHIKHDVFTIGQDFFKVGQEFIKLTGPLDTFDDAVVKFTDPFVKMNPDSGPFPLANDFVKFETDLKVTGLDFLGAASDIKSGAIESLSLDFNKISVEYKEQGNDALNLGADFADFVKITGTADSKVGESFIKISIDTVTISSLDFKLGTDFNKISTDLAATGDSGPMTFDQIIHKHAGDFIKLAEDLKLADGAFTTLGGDTIRLTNAMENPGPVILPTLKG